MMNMKLLLAGPGTGKTTRIKELISGHSTEANIFIVSFTNATIQDLLKSFSEADMDITERNCLTLHKYALRLNHQKDLHILNGAEIKILEFYAKKFNVSFGDLSRTLGCITFEQMITQTIAYIKTNPVYLKALIGDIDLFIVDEYQDFNPTERELIDLIANNASEVIILGDDDQCIYEFKDADTDGIVNLYNNSSVENIPHHNICYRCPDCIVDACTNLINENKRRVEKEWRKNNKSGIINFKQFMTQKETTGFTIDEIERIRSREPESPIMILSPVGFAVDDILAGLSDKGIEFNNLWGSRVDFEKLKRIWEVRAILGSKKLLNLLFLVHSAVKGSPKLLSAIYEIINKDLNFNSLLELVEKNNLIEASVLKLIKEGVSFQDVLGKEEYVFLTEYLSEQTLESDLEKISMLIVEPLPFDSKGINILSIHKSKGLQADYVFIVGLVEGIIPNALQGLDTIEAQRRLLFVGMSRAKKSLYCIATVEWEGKYVNKVDKKQFRFDYRTKKWHGRSSAFINELKVT